MYLIFSQLKVQHPLANPTRMHADYVHREDFGKRHKLHILTFQHLRPDPGGDQEGLQAATA